jgi:hypothetical protein
MKKILGLLCITSSMFAMELDVVKSHRVQGIFVPERLGSLELYHNDKGFSIYHDNKKHDVKKYHVDPMLRNINKKQLKGFLKNGYLSVNQMDDGEYSLKAKGRVNGGGPIGATIGVFLGKAAVSIVGHGAIQIVALCTGPAYFPVMVALESTLGVAIEKASIAGAVAGGIALGAATGPV